ncbi:MAG TPA: AbrB/MazE/SpoVT family DNA-binding domain-containing protein [Caulobacteraceae bacterium]|nr:AbrB/MazE/SpoVT family DNA-binding domain-containing protein [Caulobacteraceae bacterium]
MPEAKLFKSGGSQAVRLPKDFRFPGDRVRIHREGERVILEPVESAGRPSVDEVLRWLREIQAMAGERFERPEQPAMQERDWGRFD